MKHNKIKNNTRNASILIVEDHPVFRDGLIQLISRESDMHVSGEAESASEALNLIRHSRPDLILVDITLKESSGIELIREINRTYDHIPMLVISMHDETIFVDRVLQAGARGYIPKCETTLNIVDAIHQVLNGRIYISEQMVDRVLNRYIRGDTGNAGSPLGSLSEREFEVFSHIGQGLVNREIAGMLCVSTKTVATYRERIKEKLNIKSSSELNRYAILYFQLEQTR